MSKQIDQSGKIERTNRDTILCISNEDWDAIKIPAKVKRQLQEIFRRNGQGRNFVLFTFSAGVAILIEKNTQIYHLVIDREYFGHEAVIKNIILEMLKDKEKAPEIYFKSIGKKAMAHHRAYAVAVGKLPASHVVNLREIFKKIKTTEVGKRLKDA